MDEDLPPTSSDEEFWEEQAKKKDIPGMIKKNKFDAIAEKGDTVEEKKQVNVNEKGKDKYDVADSESSVDSEDELADVRSPSITFLG